MNAIDAINAIDPLARRRCLLILPRHFYSFEKYLCAGLEAKGYAVVVANDEYPQGLLGKVIGKLQVPTVRWSTRRTIERRYLGGQRYDLVLIFKGRGMSPRLIDRLREIGSRVVGYNWDSFRLNRAPLRWMRHADRYFTFDYRDAERWHLPVVELFSAAANSGVKKAVKYDLSVIVRNHSARLAYLHEVLSALRPQRSYIHIFELNIFTFIYNALRHPWLYWRYRRSISFKPLPYAEYSRVMAASRFTIDYAHQTQTGVTMRCFEAANSRTKIITNNPYMTRSPNFASTDVIVHPAGAPSLDLREAVRRAARAPFASRPRTLAEFIDELLAAH